MKKLRLGVQISGRGSNLQALIDACKQPDFPAEIVLVISNVPSVHGLTRAEEAHISTRVIPHKDFPTREAFEEALDAAHRAAGVELICNAGFMRIITPYMVTRWRGKMINIHPSLLPEFPGLHTHKKALEAGKTVAGCTVHFVEEVVDSGAIILQAQVPIEKGDTEETLAARVLEAEHKIYPWATKLIADGDVQYNDGNIICSDFAKQIRSKFLQAKKSGNTPYSIFMDFFSLSFPIMDFSVPDKVVYVLFCKANDREVPFYVGQTGRFSKRMEEYQKAYWTASTDFRVGEAIKYISSKDYHSIILKFKPSEDREKEEAALIKELQLSGAQLLNSIGSYDYSKANKEEELNIIHRFCDNILSAK